MNYFSKDAFHITLFQKVPKDHSKLTRTTPFQSATFDVLFLMVDANTATPQLSKPSYTLTVVENYPTGVPLTLLNISATGRECASLERVGASPKFTNFF